MDSREINMTVPMKSGGEKNPGVVDLSNPTAMASEVFRFTSNGTGNKGILAVVPRVTILRPVSLPAFSA